MKILLISPFIPYPLNSGGNQAVFSMIDSLRKKHSVSMLLQARHANKDVEALKKLWPDVRFFIYDGQGGKRRFFSLKHRIISYFSESFARKYNRFFFKYWPKHPDMASMLRIRTLINLRPVELDYGYCEFVREVSGRGFDVVQTEFNGLIDMSYCLPDDVIKVFVHHEIGFIRRENELSLLVSPTFEDLTRYRQEKDREISALRRYDHIIALTEKDKEILSEYIPEDKIYVSPAVVQQGGSMAFKACGREFVFVGGSDHFPNYDGINWLCECVLPLLRDMVPDFKVYVTGPWNKRARKAICRKNRDVEFTGFVKDIHEFLNGRIAIVPIRIGSGMRMKILDSVWSMAPFITTGKGVEGQNFIDGVDCVIADTPQAFAGAMAELSGNVRLQRLLSDNALQKINRSYDPERMLKIRSDFYDTL